LGLRVRKEFSANKLVSDGSDERMRFKVGRSC